MATYKKQLKDKDGNTIYPDVGLNLDDVVYSDDPTEPVGNPSPWILPSDISLKYMTARGTYGDTNVNGNTLIALDAYTSDGSSTFKLTNSHIVVGAGVKKVMVSANCFYSSNGAAYAWARIQKNDLNTTPDTTAIGNIVSSSYCSVQMTPIIIDVVQGDKISLYNLESNCKLRGTNTWLTVIAVG